MFCMPKTACLHILHHLGSNTLRVTLLSHIMCVAFCVCVHPATDADGVSTATPGHAKLSTHVMTPCHLNGIHQDHGLPSSSGATVTHARGLLPQ